MNSISRSRAVGQEALIRAPLAANRMRTLAETYPELRAFTPDATLNEIKLRFGLASLEEVRELARRRLAS